jgi:DNA-binding MarR family transcriptional regulator
MTHDIRTEPKRKKQSLHEEAQVNIVRTGNLVADALERVLKPHGVTATQYNVLRILRSCGPEGLCRNEVRDQLLSRMPDATRLLDRLEKAGLVIRSRDGSDRRTVTTRITDEGRRLVDKLEDIVEEEQLRQLGHLSEKQTRKLIKLLTLVRNDD